MSGLIGCSHPRPCSGAKTLRRCRNNNVEADDVIIIDIETESFDNVIIIDVPESSPKKTQRLSTRHRKDKKPLFENFRDASTSARLSEFKRTYSRNASRRNRFGLSGCISETNSSDSDIGFGCANETGNSTRHVEDISMSNIQQEEDKDGENSPPCEETFVINEREKLKETDEYKRAMEEELASRQQELQIQAEEAKNLRRLQKRREAESLRLLDMERRQKARIEEVRNIQMKDEENMNLKEKVRAELRSKFNKLEVSCRSMASLLHSLGISVDSWPHPSRQEVQTAYRRALRTFHPDRTSQSDIRQQVEAEEKFKLVKRMKERLT